MTAYAPPGFARKAAVLILGGTLRQGAPGVKDFLGNVA